MSSNIAGSASPRNRVPSRFLAAILLLAAAGPLRAATGAGEAARLAGGSGWTPPFAPAAPALVANIQGLMDAAVRKGILPPTPRVTDVAFLSPGSELDRRLIGAFAANLPAGFNSRLDAVLRSPRDLPRSEYSDLVAMVLFERDRAASSVQAAAEARVSALESAEAEGRLGYTELKAAAAELERFGFYGQAFEDMAGEVRALAAQARDRRTIGIARGIAQSLEGRGTGDGAYQQALGVEEEARLSMARRLVARLHDADTQEGARRLIEQLMAAAEDDGYRSERLQSLIAHGLIADLQDTDSGHDSLRALVALAGKSPSRTVQEDIVLGVMQETYKESRSFYWRQDALGAVVDIAIASRSRAVKDLAKSLLQDEPGQAEYAKRLSSVQEIIDAIDRSEEAKADVPTPRTPRAQSSSKLGDLLALSSSVPLIATAHAYAVGLMSIKGFVVWTVLGVLWAAVSFSLALRKPGKPE